MPTGRAGTGLLAPPRMPPRLLEFAVAFEAIFDFFHHEHRCRSVLFGGFGITGCRAGGLALLEHGNQLGTQGVPERINQRFSLFFVSLDVRQPGLELLQSFRSRAWKDLHPAFALLRQPKDRSSRVFETASVVD